MDKMMKEYFNAETFGVSPTATIPIAKDEERAVKIMESTLKRNEPGYEIGLLWKWDIIKLPESYPQALRRLASFEKKIECNQFLKDWFHAEISSYCEKGYAAPIGYYEELPNNDRNNYIPYFAVINNNKLNSKPRLVFDAAAKNKGVSLNSHLLSGPDAVASLLGVLLRFRENSFGISGDIQEMFHRVKIRKEDQCAQRFLYRRTPKNRPGVFVMKVMTFGATCSPACAQYVKNTNASSFESIYPEAVESIVRNHYVDDYLDSFTSEHVGIKHVNEVIRIHAHGNFFIRNFISNSVKILNGLPRERVSEESRLEIGGKAQEFEKVFGHYWDRTKDTLNYSLKFTQIKE